MAASNFYTIDGVPDGNTGMNCTKIPYCTRAEAEDALRKLIADAKRTRKIGTSWKRLNVYACSGHFHIGRANRLPKGYTKPASPPKVKPHSWGYIRKRVERIEKHLEYDRRKRIAAVNEVMALEQAIADQQAEMDALQREIVADFFSRRIR